MDRLGRLLPASIPASSVGLSLGNSPASVSPPTGAPFPELSYPGVTLDSPEDSTTLSRAPNTALPRGAGLAVLGQGEVHARAATPTLPPRRPGLWAAVGSSAPTSRGTEDRRCRRTRRCRRSLMESPGRRHRGRRIYQLVRLPRPAPASVRGSGTASIAPAAAGATAAAAPSPTRAAHAAGTAGRGAARRLLRSRIPRAAPSPQPGQASRGPRGCAGARAPPSVRVSGVCTASRLAQWEPGSGVRGRVLAERGGSQRDKVGGAAGNGLGFP